MDNTDQIMVWWALDADSSFFGIKGNYMLLFLIFAAAGILLSILVMQTAGRFLGFLLAFTALAAAYMLIKSLQSRYSTRQFRRFTDRAKLPRYLKVRPVNSHTLLRRRIPWK